MIITRDLRMELIVLLVPNLLRLLLTRIISLGNDWWWYGKHHGRQDMSTHGLLRVMKGGKRVRVDGSRVGRAVHLNGRLMVLRLMGNIAWIVILLKGFSPV